MKKLIIIAAAAVLMCSCAQKALEPIYSHVTRAAFQQEIDGKQTDLYTLRNKAGMEVCITNFGGHIVSIVVPDKNGVPTDVALGFDKIGGFKKQADMGSSVGRYANRIKEGRFTLDGVEYDLPKNNYGHCLHGGPKGWNHLVYDVVEADAKHLKLRMDSPDGDMGFPGAVTAFVTFTLTKDNKLDITYSATTDKPTIINMTNHAYFNLSGDPSKGIGDHILWLNSTTYTPSDATFMTTGEIAPVAGTPMDFSKPKPIGQDIECRDFDQISNANGYDHNWILDNNGDITVKSAELRYDPTGIVMEMYTDEPGVQIYTGNFLNGKNKGKDGIPYQFRAGV
ncbi:MAG: galactose mutarotase, partial [Bacteroidales bacterium]|nr:galactose mutarotase [Bacteroidales bacterium]